MTACSLFTFHCPITGWSDVFGMDWLKKLQPIHVSRFNRALMFDPSSRISLRLRGFLQSDPPQSPWRNSYRSLISPYRTGCGAPTRANACLCGLMFRTMPRLPAFVPGGHDEYVGIGISSACEWCERKTDIATIKATKATSEKISFIKTPRITVNKLHLNTNFESRTSRAPCFHQDSGSNLPNPVSGGTASARARSGPRRRPEARPSGGQCRHSPRPSA